MPLLCRVIGSVHVVRPASQRASAARGNGQRGLRPARLDAGWRRRRRAGGWPSLWPRDGAPDRARRGIQARAGAVGSRPARSRASFALVVPARPQGPAPARPIAEPADLVDIGALVCPSVYAHRAPNRPFRGSVVVTHCPASATSIIRSISAAARSSSARAATKARYRASASRLSAASQAFHARVTRCADRRQSSSR